MNIQTTKRPMPARIQPSEEQKPKQPGSDAKCPEQGPGFLEKTLDTVMYGAKMTLQEGVLAAKNDPALAMRMAATQLSDSLLKKVDAPVKDGFERTIVPVMRFALLAGNGIRAYNTLSNPLSSKFERALDIGVVASDLVGAIGGIGMLVGGQYAGIGQTMMGFSYAVDAVSHAYRGLDHAGNRIAVWTAAKQPQPPVAQN